MIRLSDRILGFTWNRLYQGINVHNAPSAFANWRMTGMKLFILPCHRSPWTTCSLVCALSRGLVPPIAAGINLNFWPAGPIFPPPGGVLHSSYL